MPTTAADVVVNKLRTKAIAIWIELGILVGLVSRLACWADGRFVGKMDTYLCRDGVTMGGYDAIFDGYDDRST